jgi:ligand-binding sensor domain-containing protein
MMRVFLFIQLFLCSFRFISCGSTPENFDFSFRRISPAGGFTYGAINTIAEDANGFIWFGTAHGLYRYNSSDVQKFVHNPNDSTTIPGNAIRTIFPDSGGKLWIGTSQGVCMYDNTRDLFVTRKFQDKSGELLDNDVREIFQYDAKNICFLGTNMLGKLNILTDHFESVAVKETLQENFSCAVSDSTGKVWIGGTNGTVWVYDSSNGNFRQFCHQRSESIQKIFSDDEGLWIGYSWSGLDHIGFHANLISHYGGDPEDDNMIHHNRVRDIYKDESGRLWISTYKGISIIDHNLTAAPTRCQILHSKSRMVKKLTI